jgi:hypothetical protein
MLMSASSSKTTAESDLVRLAAAAVPTPATNIRQVGFPPDPATAPVETTATLPLEAIASAEAAPAQDFIAILAPGRTGVESPGHIHAAQRQWLPGQGYRDFLRLCPPGRKPFDRPQANDPRHLNMKSRKTFARLQVGFVNVNADRAKCSPVATSRRGR